jgi:hypothetical protein
MRKMKGGDWHSKGERACRKERAEAEGSFHSSSVRVDGDTKRKQLTQKKNKKKGTKKKVK